MEQRQGNGRNICWSAHRSIYICWFRSRDVSHRQVRRASTKERSAMGYLHWTAVLLLCRRHLHDGQHAHLHRLHFVAEFFPPETLQCMPLA